MGDIMGEWVPAKWINTVIDVVSSRPDVVFQFLTKNPKRYARFRFPNNAWLGATMDGDKRLCENAVEFLNDDIPNIRFLSIEPLLPGQYPTPTELSKADWIIIGAMTGPGAKPYDHDLLRGFLMNSIVSSVPLFIKDSIKLNHQCRQFPFYTEGL